MNFLLQENKGSFYALLSGFLYGLLGYFGMSLVGANFSIFNMLFWRFLISSALIMIILFFTYKKNTDRPQEALKMMLYGGVFYSASATIYFLACSYIGTGLAMVIFFTYPAAVMLLNWVLHKTKPSRSYYIAIAVIMAGLVLLADLNGARLNVTGIGFAILSAIAYASYIVFSKKVQTSPLMSTLMVSMGCTITSLILTLIDKSFLIPASSTQWLNIFGFGILCTALPILLLLEALKTISSIKASLLSVLEPVFVVIFGIILLGEHVNGRQTIGILTVLTGALTTLLSTAKIEPKNKFLQGSTKEDEGPCECGPQ